MKSPETEGSFGSFSHFSPIKEALFFPWKVPEVESREDEIGLCYLSSYNSQDPIEEVRRRCGNSPYWAQDRRWSGLGTGKVGILDNPGVVSEILWSYFEDGFVAPRKGVIDKDDRCIKLVGVVVVSNKDGVLLVPREGGKNILPGAATVSVMESLELVDIAPLFAVHGHQMMCTGDHPREIFGKLFDAPFRGWEDQVVKNIILRGAREESLELRPDRLEFLGVVGGAKDLGLIWHYRASPKELEILGTLHLGVVIKFGPEDYYASLKRLNLKPDGWTEAILRFMAKRCQSRW
jgi:hypothetical protein